MPDRYDYTTITMVRRQQYQDGGKDVGSHLKWQEPHAALPKAPQIT